MKNKYNGIIVVNKPRGLTSRDVVNKVSKILNTKKIGHTGTLDPIATGVLILTVGTYTKLSDAITSTFKTYTVEAELGYETDTLDNTGNVLYSNNNIPSKEKIKESIISFIGEYDQEVPKYSAIKINGRKLYEYARKGENIVLPKRKVVVKSINNIEINNNKIKFTCVVSKGTYIRSLIRDMGLKLGTYATMTSLNRDMQSSFDMNSAVSLEDIMNNNFKLYTVKDVFSNLYVINCDDSKYKEINNGVIQKLSINNEFVLFTYNQNEIALYKKDNDVYRMYVKLLNY